MTAGTAAAAVALMMAEDGVAGTAPDDVVVAAAAVAAAVNLTAVSGDGGGGESDAAEVVVVVRRQRDDAAAWRGDGDDVTVAYGVRDTPVDAGHRKQVCERCMAERWADRWWCGEQACAPLRCKPGCDAVPCTPVKQMVRQ